MSGLTHLWLIGPRLFPVSGLTHLWLIGPRLFPVPGLTHLWLIGPRLFPVSGLTHLWLIGPRLFPVPGHTPVANWTSSVPVFKPALRSIQCWIISSLAWTPLLPVCLPWIAFWILDLTLWGIYSTALDCVFSPSLACEVFCFCLLLPALPHLIEIPMFCIFGALPFFSVGSPTTASVY